MRTHTGSNRFGVVDSESGRLLILSRDFYFVQRLQELIPESITIEVRPKNRLERYTYDFLRPGLFHYLEWNGITHEFTLRTENISPEVIRKSKIATAKARVLKKIMSLLEEMRARIKRPYMYQDHIYTRKACEAQRFKDRGYPEQELLDFPYILEYADQAKLTLREAADLVLFKASLVNETLAKTETFRIRFLKKLADATTVEAVERISAEIDPYSLDVM